MTFNNSLKENHTLRLLKMHTCIEFIDAHTLKRQTQNKTKFLNNIKWNKKFFIKKVIKEVKSMHRLRSTTSRDHRVSKWGFDIYSFLWFVIMPLFRRIRAGLAFGRRWLPRVTAPLLSQIRPTNSTTSLFHANWVNVSVVKRDVYFVVVFSLFGFHYNFHN